MPTPTKEGLIHCIPCNRDLPPDAFYLKAKKVMATCKECRRARRAKSGGDLRVNRLCVDCRGPLTPENKTLCEKCKEARRLRFHDPSLKPKLLARQKGYLRELKLRTFAAYGGCRCSCCGETTSEFLSIDHIDGNGAAQRRSLSPSHRTGAGFYHWLKKQGYPPGYRVLCVNCNGSLGFFGYCPHDLERQAVCPEGLEPSTSRV